MTKSKRKKIWVHMIVKNEENFVWFALMSVVDFVDKILIWDTGSSDKTLKIIKAAKKIKRGKIELRQVGEVDRFEYTKVRQEMFNKSDCDWVLIVDGDEVWWQDSIKKIVSTIQEKGNDLDAIVVPFYNLVGDIYHYQEDSAGEYHLLGRKGHLTVRAISMKIPGLHVSQPYGQEGYFDNQEKLIYERDPKRLLFLNTPFLHLSHLKRSSKKREGRKEKIDLGKAFKKDFRYPEIFSSDFPQGIANPWQKRTLSFVLKGIFKYPLTFIYRRVKNRLSV